MNKPNINRRAFLGGVAASAVLSKSAISIAQSTTKMATSGGMDAFFRLSGLEQANLVKNKDVTSLELVDAAIKRAEALDPKVHAIQAEGFDMAREKAKNGLVDGPFKGVPYLIKDLADYTGLPYQSGSRMFKGHMGTWKSPYVEATEAAGLVVMGKSVTPEIGLLPSTEPMLNDEPTRNPCNLDHTTGGSSGGAAAAVASGILPFAHASDGGGSIRIPASNCGLFGLKVTRNRNVKVRKGSMPGNLSVQHCVSRSVRDSAALLAITEAKGMMSRMSEVGFVSGPSDRKLKVGFQTTRLDGREPDEDVRLAQVETAKLLQSMGHEIEEVKLPFDGEEFINKFLIVWSSIPYGLAKMYEERTGKQPDETVMEPWTLGQIKWFKSLPVTALPEALLYMKAIENGMDAFYSDYDLLLQPVLAGAAVPIGHHSPNQDFDVLFKKVTDYVAYTPIQNVSGNPSMSVPLNWNAAGLPIGSMISARNGNERTLLELAYALEEAKPWADKWAPNSAANITI